MKKILIQLDTDEHPSTFDAIVAHDADVDVLLRYGGIEPDVVKGLVQSAFFTRGPKDLASMAVWVGGSSVGAGEEVLAAGDAPRALGIFQQIFDMAPDNPDVVSGLVRAMVGAGQVEEAQDLLGQLPPDLARHAAVARARAAAELASVPTPSAETSALEARVAADPDDHDARYELAGALMASSAAQSRIEFQDAARQQQGALAQIVRRRGVVLQNAHHVARFQHRADSAPDRLAAIRHLDLEHQPGVVGEPHRRPAVQRSHHRDDRLSVAGIRRRRNAESREQERRERGGRSTAVEVGQGRAYDALPDPEAGAFVAQQPAERVRHGDLAPVLHPDRARPGPGDHGVPVEALGA